MYVYSYKTGSRGARDLAAALRGKIVRHKGSKFAGSKEKVVINWGANSIDNQQVLNSTLLNPPMQVRFATNKLNFFKAMEDVEGVRIPPWTTRRTDVEEWLEQGHVVVARKLLNASSGRGIEIISAKNLIGDAPLYVRYIKKSQEFRIHVVRNTVIDIQRKARKKDVNDEDVNWKVRNLEGGFIYMRGDIDNFPEKMMDSMRSMAIKCVSALDLDFGAVDIIWNEKDAKAYVLEVNTAPGLEGSTLDNYVKAFKDV